MDKILLENINNSIDNNTDNNIDNSTNNSIDNTIEHKYGDDDKYEPWMDNNIFFPIATKMIDPLIKLKITPNQVTYMSTIFVFLAIYFIHIDKNIYAGISYFFGYLLDCIDGRMARKYNLMSNYGMALDLTSDNISNYCLFIYLIYKYGITNYYIIFLLILSIGLSLQFGFNEAIVCYKKSGHDNFYKVKVEMLKNNDEFIYKLYLFIIKTSYETYRLFFPTYNEENIKKWLSLLREFGPGNYVLIVIIVLMIIK